MSELPWFPFWTSDFLASRKVRVMTPEQVGIYVLLLCHQWEAGPLPTDEGELSALANGADLNAVRTVLERCFVSVPNGYVNTRLERVREEQEESRAQKVAAGRASGKARRRKRLQEGTAFERRSNSVAVSFEQSESESETEEKPPLSPLEGEAKKGDSPKPKRSRLPSDWKPTDEHRERAKAEGIDLAREVEKFRAHAEANDRRQVRWNAAFTTWLLNAKDFAPNGARTNGKPQPRSKRTVDAEHEAEIRRQMERMERAAAQ